MLQTNYTSYKYNPDEINEKDFLENFVIRNDIFEDIFEDIKNVDFNVANQHYIIVGQRGQGKTSLLRRITIAIKDDKKLAKFMIPVKFSEEQYQIRSLCRFFEVIAEELQENNSEIFPNILDNLESHIDDEDYYLKCFEYFEDMVKSQKKKLIILSDNIDELLGKLKEQEQRQLRQILITSSTIRIIGASTKMIEQHFDYAKPFYEYFKLIKLDGLDYDESIKFLRVIGDKEQNKKIEKIIKDSPQRIETLRQLTGGVPRTLVMLYDIFIQNNETAFEDLLKILDDVTLLYKDRMDNLPDILQDIVHNIAMNWDGISTKELAKKTRLESKSVSSQLKQLEKYHIIEFEKIGKNKIYKIKERFFNIWYLMRFGRKKDRNKVEWLVKFLTSWYDKNELNIKAKAFINSIKDQNLNENYVYHMCEGLSYAGLDLDIEHQMKRNTKEYFSKQKSSLKNELAKSDAEILQEVLKLIDNGEKLEAIKLLVQSKKSSQAIISTKASLYHLVKEYEKAEEFYLKAIENGDNGALNNLGTLYSEQKEYEKAEEFYLKAIENGDNGALNNLGTLYSEQKEYEKAEVYYLKAIKSGNNDTLFNLGNLYSKKKEYEKAEEFYLKAIESGNNDALNNLGILYSEQKEYEKAKEFYLKAIESGNNDALNNLGILYSEQKEYEKAEEFHLKAIESGENGAFNNLGILYSEQKEYEKAKVYYLKAIESGNNDALNNLGNLYSKKKEYEKAEEFYLKAIESGNNDALNNLGTLYSEQKEYEKAEEFYLKAIESGNNNALNNLGYLNKEQKEYEKAEEFYLKAIENGDNDALNNLGTLYSEQKEYEKAEEFYLKAIESGENGALINLGTLYTEQKEYEKAKEFYLKAIESGNNDALNNLGNLYSKKKEYEKAEEFYLKAIESGNNGALNSLSWSYFEQTKKIDKAIELAKQSYNNKKSFYNTHTLAIIMLWNEELEESYAKFIDWLEYDDALESENNIIIYLNLLISKGQLYKAKEFLEMPKYQLKDRYKPIWYALMTLMENDFPNEIKKMGSELKQSVGEILEVIAVYKEKYAT